MSRGKRQRANGEPVSVRYTDGSEHPGTLAYRTTCGQWLGVMLDGERRVDEYPIAFVVVL